MNTVGFDPYDVDGYKKFCSQNTIQSVINLLSSDSENVLAWKFLANNLKEHYAEFSDWHINHIYEKRLPDFDLSITKDIWQRLSNQNQIRLVSDVIQNEYKWTFDILTLIDAYFRGDFSNSYRFFHKHVKDVFVLVHKLNKRELTLEELYKVMPEGYDVPIIELSFPTFDPVKACERIESIQLLELKYNPSELITNYRDVIGQEEYYIFEMVVKTISDLYFMVRSSTL